MPESRTTSVQRTGDLLRQGAASLVLREAFFRVRRFDDFQRVLGLSRSVLARTLKTLVEGGILERRRYQQRPDRYEYLLTDAGLELYPIFLAMKQWGDKWLGDDAREVVLFHKLCGHRSTPAMTCDHCGEPVKAREMHYKLDGEEE
ncbi:MAG TPA: helix-turn-helix domain-containing protein [Microbacterium sp.]|uniref:winged helix-turn-helix transcriptional regulator n=1 Tax=Microbacterium sp. TaxID=51671 RepID=UPI002CE4DAE0|nr:helix-turn-helix domain-containing protein [Microbacterium sp.]HWI32426.1 helix-turn-helix domain-containing protein [Microbacterium sp.]